MTSWDRQWVVLLRELSRPLLLICGLAVVAFLIYRVGLHSIVAAFDALSWRLFVVVLFPASAAVALDTLGWRFAFPRPPRSFARLIGARVAGEAVNLATPTASVGGEPVKAYLLRPTIPLRDGLASVVVDKTTAVVSLTFVLAVGLLVGRALLPPSSRLVLVMTGLLVIEILAVSGFVAAQLRGAAGRGGRLLGRLGVGPSRENQAKLDGLDRVIQLTYRQHWPRLLPSTLCHFVAFSLGGLEVYLVVRCFGFPISLPQAFAMEAFSTGVKFTSFMVPASLGALEGGNVAIFSAFGLDPAVGLSYSLVRRVREIVWVLVGFAALNVLTSRPVPPTGEATAAER